MKEFKIVYIFRNKRTNYIGEGPDFPSVYKAFWEFVKNEKLWKKSVRPIQIK